MATGSYTSQANAKRDELVAQVKGAFGGGEGGGEGLPRDAALVGAGLLAGLAIAQLLGL